MKYKYILFTLVPFLMSFSPYKLFTVSSPDKTIKVEFFLDESGTAHYSVFKLEKEIVNPSRLGFLLKDSIPLNSGFEFKTVRYYTQNETWYQPWGACKTVKNHHEGMMVALENKSGYQLNIEFRVFDDGIAFRYIFSQQALLDSVIITDEQTQFCITENPQAFWTIADYYANYEKVFNQMSLQEVSLASTPLTMRRKDSIHLAIHEAALYNYADMHLKNIGNALQTSLVPKKNGTKVKLKTPASTPWRMLVIAQDAKELLESNLLLNLNEPCKIKDTSWIKPMKYMGIWWGMHLGTQTWAAGSRHGATTKNTLALIDFAKAHHIQGVVVEGWNTGWENWGKAKAFDFVTPYPDYDLKAIAQYAQKKGVELIMHHETGGDITTYEQEMDTAFALCKTLGIKALKTGYAGSISTGEYHHSQPTVEHYQRVVEKAAQYGLMLDVHEPIKPTGICRTYPNLMTGEGVKGMEWEAWSTGNTPSHTVMIPFVRGLAGPVDYTPGIFDILYQNSKNKRTAWNCEPEMLSKTRVHSTLCHQLALLVVLYSPMQMLSDLPENYKNHPAFRFAEDLNIDFDTSMVLNAEIGEFLTIARKSGNEWFLGSITNETARNVSIPLSFLEPNTTYQAQIYRDADNADWLTNPTAYAIDKALVTNRDNLTLKLAAGGGTAIRFVKSKENKK